jgi:RNA polymerase sigma-70 factor (ECF subfamily)
MQALQGMPDEALVESARAGELDAFNVLVDRYQRAVYTLCLRILGERGAAEDATQEAFISAFRSIARYEGGSFRSWLYRIAANESKDELRRRRRKDVAFSLDAPIDDGDTAPDVPDAAPGADELLLRGELGHRIEGHLSALPFEQRQALVLVDAYGFQYEEVASMTGSSLGTVKSRIHRGRERLRALVLADPELSGLVRRQEGERKT